MLETLLVVDDDPGMVRGMFHALRRQGYRVDTATDGEQALTQLSRTGYRLVITDLRMPRMDGHTLLRRIRLTSPRTQVLVVTAFATVESAVSCVRDGAVDYLMKPFSPEALQRAVRDALGRADEQRAAQQAPPLIAEDPAMWSTLEWARRAAGSDATVLLEAESGAGKEVIARYIHAESARKDGPFVAVNCAAVPRDLLEAELFGHCKGAFTGAQRERKGRFLSADGGTLLLDEIGEMHPDLQARLLRVLQDRWVQPVGSDTAIHTDVRVIASTNRNLRADVADGRFREDLYYRLQVLPIHIPSLRERPRDIEPLARAFVRRFAGAEGELTAEALTRLLDHEWPGNVRELENTLQRAVILGDGPRIEARHIELESLPVATDASISPLTLEDAERETIGRILERTGGNRTEAAAALGISPRTLRHKLKRFRDAGQPVLEKV